jgi:methionyl aminopeptidase
MITIKSESDRQAMMAAGAVVYETLQALKAAAKPGMKTMELEEIAQEIIVHKHKAVPSFKGYNGFPYILCISIDDVVVHGMPSKKTVLREGMIVGIDCGAIVDGFHGDSALTVPIGQVSPEVERLIAVTEESFWKGADAAREGARISDVGHAVQVHCAQYGYDVVRALCGHGIGQAMHEDPEVPNYGPPGRGVRLRAGMSIAVEPMVVTGKYPVYTEPDGWTVRTRDGGLCAHYEHTLFIRPGGARPQILTMPTQPEGWL